MKKFYLLLVFVLFVKVFKNLLLGVIFFLMFFLLVIEWLLEKEKTWNDFYEGNKSLSLSRYKMKNNPCPPFLGFFKALLSALCLKFATNWRLKIVLLLTKLIYWFIFFFIFDI